MYQTLKSRVLLIERHDDTRWVLRLALQWAGFAVIEAAGYAPGLALARRDLPDLVILDVAPLEDAGSRFLDPYRSANERPVPVVALANGGPALREQLHQTGAVAAVVGKPFDVEHFLAVVRDCLSAGHAPSTPTGGADSLASPPPRASTRFGVRSHPTGGAGIWDSELGEWTAHQPFADDRLAWDVAETLNQRETARRQGQWLDRQDRQRGRK